jgi:hypothetical protein
MGAKNTSKYTGYFKPGQAFGKYTIMTGDIVKGNNNGESKVECLCECGNINIVSCLTLIKGVSNGCMLCTHSKKGEEHPSFNGYKEIPGSWFSRYSKTKKREFNITIEDIYEMWINQDKKCKLSGLNISFENTNTKKTRHRFDLVCTASLDRIDSKKGYTLDNIQLVHKNINMMKKEYNQKYFIELCKLVTDHINSYK